MREVHGVKPYYDDGTVTIYHGDCLEGFAAAWDEADLLLTDPPYGIDHASNQEGRFKGSAIAGDGDLGSRNGALARWGRERPAYVFGSWKRSRPERTRTVLVWDKGMASGMGDLSLPWKPNWEEIYVLGDGFAGHRGTSILTGTVVTWSGAGPAAMRHHPNEKPVSLLRELIGKVPTARVVLDPFMGSGSTLRAAKDLGRKAIGIEIEERYCEIAAKRLGQEVLDFGEAA